MEFNLIGPSYQDSTKPISFQRTLNWVPEKVQAEGRVQQFFRTPPGLLEFGTVTATGCRGMQIFDGMLYAVYDNRLYRINSSGIETDLGNIDGDGPVCMIINAVQLIITTGGTAYVYDGATLTSIAGLNSPNTCAFLDQYVIFDGDGGQFQLSALNDAGSIDPLDFATAESAPDDTIAVFVDHQEAWICGTDTIEIWVNTGDPDFPLSRTQGSLIERGVGGPYTLQKVDNTVYWLDNLGMVQGAAGHSPSRISTHAQEEVIKQYLDRLDEFFAWSYVDKGHWFYVLQCPDFGPTFVYDASTQLWHDRATYGLDCWKARHHSMIYGKHIVGDYASGKVWELKDDLYVEGDDPLVSERYTQYIHNQDQPIYQHSLWLKFDTGQATISGQGSDPMVDIRWSDDGGYTWSNYRQRSLGLIGNYNKDIRVHGMGRFKDRLFHIRVVDPVKRDLLTAYVRPSVGQDA